MELDVIILSGICQAQKAKYRLFHSSADSRPKMVKIMSLKCRRGLRDGESSGVGSGNGEGGRVKRIKACYLSIYICGEGIKKSIKYCFLKGGKELKEYSMENLFKIHCGHI
jgi:hypothetical protein